MITKILIITKGGLACYIKDFLKDTEMDLELACSFFSALNSATQEINLGGFQSFNFKNLKLITSTDKETECLFIIAIHPEDLLEEAQEKLKLLQDGFLIRYSDILKNWDGNIKIFSDFTEFVEKNIFIPLRVLLVGEEGVGKTTISNFFSGNIDISRSDAKNRVKTIEVIGLEALKQFELIEQDLNEIINYSKKYRDLLDKTDIVILVTNSAASNLTRTKYLLKNLKPLLKKSLFYIIANWQDLEELVYKPEKIEKMFDGIKTYGFSAVEENAKKKIFQILGNILSHSVEIKYFI